MHSGGLRTGQYFAIDAERFQELREDQAHVAYDHGVSEIYIPGTATNDKEERLQFPVASGLWKEAGPVVQEPLPPVDPHELWQTTEDEVLPSSQRPASATDVDSVDPSDAGGHGVQPDGAHADADVVLAPTVADPKDCWSIQGDYLVRIHNVPRTTMFAPWMVSDDDAPPVPIRHLEVSRTTNPKFSGGQWPGMEIIEDAWSGHESDKKVLRHPVGGSTLTWTGETNFESRKDPT